MLLPTLALFAAPFGVITVDDNGPADYADLPPAVAAAQAGDTILIAPGLYHPTPITKALSFVGADPGGERPIIGFSTWQILGAPSVSLQGVGFLELKIQGVPGRVRLDDLDEKALLGPLFVKDCPDVLITRSRFEGNGFPIFSGDPALWVADSSVVIVDSTLIGADGQDDVIFPDDGYAAIYAEGTSSLTLIGSTVTGGDGGYSALTSSYGAPAIAEVWSGGLSVEVRGSSFDVVSAGSGASPGPQAVVAALVWSGASIIPSPFVAPLSPATPYLSIGGGFESGALRRAEVYGAAGDPCLVFFSLAPANLAIPGLLGDLVKLDPGQLVATIPLTLMSQDVGATALFAPPFGMPVVGLAVDAQALVTSAAGLWVTNTHQLVLLP